MTTREPADPVPQQEILRERTPVGDGADAYTLQMLRVVWERQRHRIDERLALVERTVDLLCQGRHDTARCRDAMAAAHMLAGTVGTFGFIDASVAARELEQEFADPETARPLELSVLVRRLRRGLEGEVSLIERRASVRTSF